MKIIHLNALCCSHIFNNHISFIKYYIVLPKNKRLRKWISYIYASSTLFVKKKPRNNLTYKCNPFIAFVAKTILLSLIFTKILKYVFRILISYEKYLLSCVWLMWSLYFQPMKATLPLSTAHLLPYSLYFSPQCVFFLSSLFACFAVEENHHTGRSMTVRILLKVAMNIMYILSVQYV